MQSLVSATYENNFDKTIHEYSKLLNELDRLDSVRKRLDGALGHAGREYRAGEHVELRTGKQKPGDGLARQHYEKGDVEKGGERVVSLSRGRRAPEAA